MLVIWGPMWKWSSCRQSSIPTARSSSTAETIPAVVSPNLERSPVDSTHLPAPLVVSRARTPITGRRSSSAAAARMVSSSPLRSIVMTTRRPSFWARSAVSMKARSLYPLQRMNASGFSWRARATSSSGLDTASIPRLEGRQVGPAAAEVVHERLEVDAKRPRPGGRDLDVAGLVDREEVPTPPVDVVQLDGGLD